MATYNGSKYIKQQLDSLLSQTYQQWQLFIRDDGSSDDTVQTILAYVEQDSRISLIEDNLGNLRSSLNFNALMEYAQDLGEYFMFCDQDDIWFETKIEETLIRMKEIEMGGPALVFGTQALIDENGRGIPIDSKNYNFKIRLETLIATNFIYGCTMMINRKLLKKSIPIPSSAENHDYWIALIAASCTAKTSYISHPLMYYRQHSSNVSGSFRDASFFNRIKRLRDNKEFVTIVKRTKMFEDLLSHTDSWISDQDKIFLVNYNRIVPSGGLRALNFVLSNKIQKLSKVSTLNYYFSILRG